jgi:Recombination endonuclease VII
VNLKTHCKRGHEFTPESTYVNAKGHRICRECARLGQQRYREKYPEKYKESASKRSRFASKRWRDKNPDYHKNLHIKLKYGLTSSSFSEMLKTQNGMCYLCKSKLMNPCVDHDHVSGRVRKILCSQCNSGLGMFHDNPEVLEKAAAYVRKHANAQ